MEYINKIELQGKVGHVQCNEFRGQHVQHFSLATQYISKNSLGDVIYETTWHSVTAWDKEQVKQGDTVNVVGRLRQVKYTSSEGTDNVLTEVVVNELKIIE